MMWPWRSRGNSLQCTFQHLSLVISTPCGLSREAPAAETAVRAPQSDEFHPPRAARVGHFAPLVARAAVIEPLGVGQIGPKLATWNASLCDVIADLNRVVLTLTLLAPAHRHKRQDYL